MFVKASEPSRPVLVLAEGDKPLHDDGIEEGNVGIRVGTSESVVTCSFRDFSLSSL